MSGVITGYKSGDALVKARADAKVELGKIKPVNTDITFNSVTEVANALNAYDSAISTAKTAIDKAGDVNGVAKAKTDNTKPITDAAKALSAARTTAKLNTARTDKVTEIEEYVKHLSPARVSGTTNTEAQAITAAKALIGQTQIGTISSVTTSEEAKIKAARISDNTENTKLNNAEKIRIDKALFSGYSPTVSKAALHLSGQLPASTINSLDALSLQLPALEPLFCSVYRIFSCMPAPSSPPFDCSSGLNSRTYC